MAKPGLLIDYKYLINTMDNQFKIGFTIECLEKICKCLDENKEVPFQQFCKVLEEFTVVFNKLNSFLGIAFQDVHKKVKQIRANKEKYPGHTGFFSFINMEMKNNLHTINGKDNKKKKLPEDLINYSSTARNLLRMMWLLTFIRVTFERCRDHPQEKLSATFGVAYDSAFGNNHSWVVRNSAKVAMYATQDKKQFVQVILHAAYDQKIFNEYNEKFLKVLVPVHDALWGFYKENNISKLD